MSGGRRRPSPLQGTSSRTTIRWLFSMTARTSSTAVEAPVSIDEVRPTRPGKQRPDGPPARVVAVAQYYPPHVGGLEVVAMRQATSHAAVGRPSSVVTCSIDGPSRGVQVGGGGAVPR